jgi:hypothetical protein
LFYFGLVRTPSYTNPCVRQGFKTRKEVFKNDQEFGRTLSNPRSNLDLFLSRREDLNSSQEPIFILKSDRRKQKVSWATSMKISISLT